MCVIGFEVIEDINQVFSFVIRVKCINVNESL